MAQTACATAPERASEQASEQPGELALTGATPTPAVFSSAEPPSDTQWFRAGRYEVALSSREVPDGGVVLVQLKLAPGLKAEALRARLLDYEFPFFWKGGAEHATALVGVPIDKAAGTYQITVGDGESWASIPVVVKPGAYESEVLKVPPRKVEPTAKDMVRIKREQAEIGEIYHRLEREKLWEGPFQLPVQSVITSRFGNKRIFNGKMQSFHNGLDLRAATGTPIYAPADGKVVLAKDLFFSGGTVILSHGYGIYTLYAHMSAVRVKKGARVKVGRLLGLAGATGRVSGPHLHWGVILSRVKVDPLEFMKVLR